MALYMKTLDEICLLLDTYKGRDKILRTLCYVSRLAGGLNRNKELSERLLQFSRIMSATRTTLRLLDDIPMIKYAIEYGLGQDEPDRIMSSIGVLSNLIDLVYYPIEKVSWLAEHNLITGVDSDKWDNASSVCWVATTYLALIKTLKYIVILQRQKQCLSLKDSERTTLERLVLRQHFEILTCVRMSLDLIHSVNTLPPGFLWSSKLNTWQIGLIGTMSSVLGLYQIFAKRKL